MRRLSGALVSWLTFQQAAKRSIMYDEFYMYTPIFELASARQWKAIPQFSPETDNGTSQRFDFVFFRATPRRHGSDGRVAALEVSYISWKKKSWKANKIDNDEEKLRNLETKDFKGGRYGPIKRYVMIAGKENDLEQYCKKHYCKAMPVLGGSQKRIGWIHRSSIKFRAPDDDKGHISTCWCVMVLHVPKRQRG